MRKHNTLSTRTMPDALDTTRIVLTNKVVPMQSDPDFGDDDAIPGKKRKPTAGAAQPVKKLKAPSTLVQSSDLAGVARALLKCEDGVGSLQVVSMLTRPSDRRTLEQLLLQHSHKIHSIVINAVVEDSHPDDLRNWFPQVQTEADKLCDTLVSYAGENMVLVIADSMSEAQLLLKWSTLMLKHDHRDLFAPLARVPTASGNGQFKDLLHKLGRATSKILMRAAMRKWIEDNA